MGMLVRMRSAALFATALVVPLLACTAAGPPDPTGRTPTVAPAAEPAPVAPAVAPAAEPAPAASPVEPAVAGATDCGLRATLTAEPGQHGARKYTLTLKNEGTAARTLVTPGDGSEDGRRTPMLAWSGTRDGKPAPQLPRPHCGMMNRIEPDEIFTLAPGASRAMSDWISGPSYDPGRYEVQLRYTNDPTKEKADASPEVAALLAGSSACEVTSAPLAITVP